MWVAMKLGITTTDAKEKGQQHNFYVVIWLHGDLKLVGI
jgi:hypothetical protein